MTDTLERLLNEVHKQRSPNGYRIKTIRALVDQLAAEINKPKKPWWKRLVGKKEGRPFWV